MHQISNNEAASIIRNQVQNKMAMHDSLMHRQPPNFNNYYVPDTTLAQALEHRIREGKAEESMFKKSISAIKKEQARVARKRLQERVSGKEATLKGKELERYQREFIRPESEKEEERKFKEAKRYYKQSQLTPVYERLEQLKYANPKDKNQILKELYEESARSGITQSQISKMAQQVAVAPIVAVGKPHMAHPISNISKPREAPAEPLPKPRPASERAQEATSARANEIAQELLGKAKPSEDFKRNLAALLGQRLPSMPKSTPKGIKERAEIEAMKEVDEELLLSGAKMKQDLVKAGETEADAVKIIEDLAEKAIQEKTKENIKKRVEHGDFSESEEDELLDIPITPPSSPEIQLAQTIGKVIASDESKKAKEPIDEPFSLDMWSTKKVTPEEVFNKYKDKKFADGRKFTEEDAFAVADLYNSKERRDAIKAYQDIQDKAIELDKEERLRQQRGDILPKKLQKQQQKARKRDIEAYNKISKYNDDISLITGDGFRRGGSNRKRSRKQQIPSYAGDLFKICKEKEISDEGTIRKLTKLMKNISELQAKSKNSDDPTKKKINHQINQLHRELEKVFFEYKGEGLMGNPHQDKPGYVPGEFNPGEYIFGVATGNTRYNFPYTYRNWGASNWLTNYMEPFRTVNKADPLTDVVLVDHEVGDARYHPYAKCIEYI